MTPEVLTHATWGLFLGCLLLTAALTPLAMRFARWVGAVDRGGYRKVYRGEMPLLGGLGVALPLVTLSLTAGISGHLIVHHWKWLWRNHREWFDLLFTLASNRGAWLTLAVGGVAIVVLGVIDDTKGMRARYKLLGQVAVALYVCLSGHALRTVAVPFLGVLDLGYVPGLLLTMFWVVGLINAFNLIDGIDGLATGIAFVGAAALVILSLIQENYYTTLVGAALAGSLLAFLFYNFPPARIFLGDTGSMFLGYALAMMSLMGSQKSEAAVIVFAPMLALSLPVFETLVSILRRYIGGVPVFAGDNLHTHHRLLRKGYSQPRVVLTLCGMGAILAAAAILSALIPEQSRWAWSPYALYFATLINIAWLAGYLRPTTLKAVLERRHRNRVFQALGRYAALRLSAGLRSVESSLLLELCRRELGLRHIEVRTPSGDCLVASPEKTDASRPRESAVELLVKSSEGQDVLVCYGFEHAPDAGRRQDVSQCLAGIFDGIRLDSPDSVEEPAEVRADRNGHVNVVRFDVGSRRSMPE